MRYGTDAGSGGTVSKMTRDLHRTQDHQCIYSPIRFIMIIGSNLGFWNIKIEPTKPASFVESQQFLSKGARLFLRPLQSLLHQFFPATKLLHLRSVWVAKMLQHLDGSCLFSAIDCLFGLVSKNDEVFQPSGSREYRDEVWQLQVVGTCFIRHIAPLLLESWKRENEIGHVFYLVHLNTHCTQAARTCNSPRSMHKSGSKCTRTPTSPRIPATITCTVRRQPHYTCQVAT